MQKEQFQPMPSRIHVCSLSISALRKIEKQEMEDEERDRETNYKLKWLRVAMTYNRILQLQYIYKTLHNKGKSPQFRAVRMNPFWHRWKKEVLRSDWATLRECVDRRMANREIDDKSNFLQSQRIELAARHFIRLDVVKKVPIDDIVNTKPLKPVWSFEQPKGIRPGYLNQVLDLCASTQITTMSELPSNTTTQSTETDYYDKPFQERFKELAQQRGFAKDDDFEPDLRMEEHLPIRDRRLSYGSQIPTFQSTSYDYDDSYIDTEISENSKGKVRIDEKGRRVPIHEVAEREVHLEAPKPRGPPPKPDYSLYFIVMGLILAVCLVYGLKQIDWGHLVDIGKKLFSSPQNATNATQTLDVDPNTTN